MHRNGEPHPPWLWPNLLGLDAPAVAVAWQWLFARAFGADLPPVFHIILGLSVWCVYLADRLYDAFRAPPASGQTDRLLFTKRHFTVLSVAAIAAALANSLLIICNVPRPLMLTGALTAALLIIYYILRIKGSVRLALAIPREVLCGMIFGLGCVIAPHAFLPHWHGADYFTATILLGLLCSANCALISHWEKEEDRAGNDHSMASLPSPILPYMAHALTNLTVLAAAMSLLGAWRIHLAVAAGALSLRFMLGSGENVSRRALRVLADVVLLTPLIFLWP